MTPMWKPSGTARKLKQRRDRLDRKNAEQTAKRAVRKVAGGRCRFPLCGCRKMGLALVASLEVSHDKHKGMGGNPAGDRSTPEIMILFCKHRHQFGRISRHAGTLRTEPIVKRLGNNGPVKFLVDVSALRARVAGDAGVLVDRWRVVARESAPGVLLPLTDWQRRTLERLATMED